MQIDVSFLKIRTSTVKQWLPLVTPTETEEVLVYRSLSKIIKIWSRGSGKANLTLDVNDRKCEYKLSVSLG